MLLVFKPADPDPYFTHITTVGPAPEYYWAMRETSGTVANDEIVGGDMDGVYANSPTFNQNSITPSATTKSIELNGSSQSVTGLGGGSPYDEFNFIHQTGIFTISCWIQINSLVGQQCIMGSTAATAETGFFFMYDNVSTTTGLRIVIPRGVGGSPTADATRPLAIPSTGTPYHVAVTGAGNGQLIRIYVNGDEDLVGGTMNNFSTGDANRNPNIGRWNYSSPGGYFNGTIEDLAVWDTQLSEAQIQAQYNAG